MTVEEAKQLRYRQVLHYAVGPCSAKPERWRVNGKVKTWKRDLGRVEVPVKWGLYWHGYLTERNVDCFHFEEDCPCTKH